MQRESSSYQFPHSFHIPVMGLGFTVDTPLKVARYGISSVVSVMEDHLLEQMRAYHSLNNNLPYVKIESNESDARARRITAYLDMLHELVSRQIDIIKSLPLEPGNDLDKYFELLPENSEVKHSYREVLTCLNEVDKQMAIGFLKNMLTPGDIDINIMTKLDKLNYGPDGEVLGPEYADAVSALRGFANSKLSSSVVFSAGLNPRLYGYCEQIKAFYPDANGRLEKRIILKVSDYRSAKIQGLFLAKKGLWVSEFRIESGLNCGGHAFATEGFLMGPILEEFKQNRESLNDELYRVCTEALKLKQTFGFKDYPVFKLTAQGGVGTSEEHLFLLTQYGLSSVGWGSPFLLVPEATNVDEDTLQKLASAVPSDYYLSHASPLGVPFNNFRPSSSEFQRKQRIVKGRPGSPCYKKFLAMDTEFTDLPICTASRQYQKLKIAQIQLEQLPADETMRRIAEVEEKDCLCEGLGVPALLRNGLTPPHKLNAVVVCPGPNLAFFSGTFSLERMVSHIYGRESILNRIPRPHMFVNELYLYIDYLKTKISKPAGEFNAKTMKSIMAFKDNLKNGVAYYQNLLNSGLLQGQYVREQLRKAEERLNQTEAQIQALFTMV